MDSVPFTTSEVIAEFAGVQHHTVKQLIVKHKADFEFFGVLAFEMRKLDTGRKGGRPETIYHLNEQQATLLITYLKNTAKVRAFKVELVRQFYAMRTELLNRKDRRSELKPVRRELTDVVKEKDNAPWAYKKYTDLAYKAALGKNAAQLRQERGADKKAKAVDYMTAEELARVSKRQNQIAVLLEMGMDYSSIKALALAGS